MGGQLWLGCITIRKNLKYMLHAIILVLNWIDADGPIQSIIQFLYRLLLSVVIMHPTRPKAGHCRRQ